MIDLAKAFLMAAEEDLAAASRLLPDLPRPAGYHLQQAAEKLAKSLLAATGVVPVPRSHDIGYLAARLPPGDPLMGAVSSLTGLAEFQIATRYPIGEELVPAPAPDVLKIHVEAIEQLRKAIEGRLTPP